jgi:hypothetical protein
MKVVTRRCKNHFIQTTLAVGAKKVYLDILERFQQAK